MPSDSNAPSTSIVASIVVPTRARPDYLEVALASISPQARAVTAELIVIDDAGPSEPVRKLAERFGARYEPHPRPLGLNVARNTGVELSVGELVVFVDDDVEVSEGWLEALLAAACEHPGVEVFTGPIRPRLEGTPPHSCGREAAPITSLDLGQRDTSARFAWGANMAIRRSALDRIGPFDVSFEYGGDEQEWQERLIRRPRGEQKSGANEGAESGANEGAESGANEGAESGANGSAESGANGSAESGANEGAESGANGSAESGTSRRLPTRSANGHPQTEPVLYVADAALDHRRSPADARLGRLSRAAYARGRASRRFDAWRGEAPSLAGELRTLAACLGHVVRRRCPAGLTMVAHSGGRLREALRDEFPLKVPRKSRPTRARRAGLFADPQLPHKAHPSNATYPSDDPCSPDDFLSGESGTVGGLDGLRRAWQDLAEDALDTLSGRRRRLDRAAHHKPPTRKVLVLGIERPEHSELARGIRTELARSRHNVEVCFATPADRGKFENLNLLLESHKAEDCDWLVVIDDDIVLPGGFLDRFLFLAERFRLDLVQPAHRLASHAAWRVTRRRFGDVARETRFVEIGPLTAFAHSTISTLLPFPDLRMGWGLDLHWAALARERDWRCGVIDAVPISHLAAPAASTYSREQALTEARTFLSSRPYLSASEAQQTLVTHRRW